MSFFLFLFGTLILQAQTTPLDRIYATVNDEVITTSDIESYQKQLKSRLLYEDLLFADDAAIDAAVKDKNLLIEKLISEKIIDSEGKKLGINIADDRIRKEIENKGGEKHLTTLLSKKGLTLKDYKDFLKKKKHSAFIDVYSKMLNSDGKPMDDIFLDDKLHMNNKGYAIWQKEIQPFSMTAY